MLLARLFAHPANVLVLDEPTNDLDFETLELLEGLLQEFQGTVFLVGHDRAFLDNVVTSVVAFDGAGLWREYEGSVEDWMTQSKRAREIAARNTPDSPTAAPRGGGPGARSGPAPGNAQKAQLQGAARVRDPARTDRRARGGAEAHYRSPSSSTEAPSTPARPRVPPSSRNASFYAQIDEELLAAMERWEELDSARQG